MVDTALATAADYADAMLVARRIRNCLSGLILLALLAQITLFCICRFTNAMQGTIQTAKQEIAKGQLAFPKLEEESIPLPPLEPAATQPGASVVAATQPVVSKGVGARLALMEYMVGGSAFVAMVASILLVAVMLVISQIMLIGRLIGVSQVMGGLFLAMILSVMLFPWQALLNFSGTIGQDVRIPGVLYTWAELVGHVQFSTENWAGALLGWSRFVGFPILAVLLLLILMGKSGKGMSQALGERDPNVQA